MLTLTLIVILTLTHFATLANFRHLSSEIFRRNRRYRKINRWAWQVRLRRRRFWSEQNPIDRSERDLIHEHAAARRYFMNGTSSKLRSIRSIWLNLWSTYCAAKCLVLGGTLQNAVFIFCTNLAANSSSDTDRCIAKSSISCHLSQMSNKLSWCDFYDSAFMASRVVSQDIT